MTMPVSRIAEGYPFCPLLELVCVVCATRLGELTTNPLVVETSVSVRAVLYIINYRVHVVNKVIEYSISLF